MTKEEMDALREEPDGLWTRLRFLGGDGYDDMEIARRRGWHAVPTWGPDDWPLGNWPLVIIFWKQPDPQHILVAEYVEGDVTQYCVTSNAERDAVTDAIARFHWAHQQGNG